MTTYADKSARLRDIASDFDDFRHAVHEAGHLLLAVHFGVEIDYATVIPPTLDSFGVVYMNQEHLDALPPADACVIFCAGGIAEMRHLKKKSFFFPDGDQQHFERAISRAATEDRDRIRREAKYIANAMIVRNWELLDRLARELYVKQTLTEAEAKQIINTF